jgi:RimJ/RimL family protein N-acetyltransferase
MMQPPSDALSTLGTASLTLAPMVSADAGELFEVLRDGSLYVFTGGAAPGSVEELADRIRGWERRRSPDGAEVWLNWTVRELATGRVAGYVQATVVDTHADVAWVTGVAYQSKGYASEAARAVAAWLTGVKAVPEVRANIARTHRASERVAEKAGFQRTDDVTEEGEIVWMWAAPNA